MALGGAYAYLHGGRYVSSDNAFVQAGKLTVTAEIPGTVAEVMVRDNERVAQGHPLFRLEDEPYRLALAEARAQLEAVRIELAALRGSHRQKLAAMAEAEEQAAFAERELQRQESLSASRAAAGVELDQARHKAAAARRHVAVLEQEAATVLASLGGDPNRPDEQHPRFAASIARVDQAERNLRKTLVRAPFAGVAAHVSSLAPGKYLAAAQPALSLVATEQMWIEANLKETELTHLKPGDPVTVRIDTYPDRTWRGLVADISPATGAEFALIPPQNASGNWIKTVQRIPVRVQLQDEDPACALRAGLSAEVVIDTGHVRSWRDLTRVFHGPGNG